MAGPQLLGPCCREERGGGGGVAILCSGVFRNNVSVWQKDQSGRILSLLVKFDDFNLNLVNLYVPTIPVHLVQPRPFNYQQTGYLFGPTSSV